MYQEHPVFVQPGNENVKVWRYMDFTKLVSLIDSRRLFFTRADKFEDPFEGSWPRINVLARQQAPADLPDASRENYLNAMASLGRFTKQYVKRNAINCWHMNEHESAAMWKLYLKSDEGIAVQSTYTKLRSSITDNEPVYLGVVKYIDYESEWIDAGNAMTAFVHKRKSFEHEREVRAMVCKWPESSSEELDMTYETIGNGIEVKVDVERLIERIYIAPSAPSWFADLVRALIQRYGYKFDVMHSKLNQQPLF